MSTFDNLIVDGNNSEVLIVRRDGDSGDVFVIDTSTATGVVTITGELTVDSVKIDGNVINTTSNTDLVIQRDSVQKIVVDGSEVQVSDDIRPTTNNAYDLGQSTRAFRDIYASRSYRPNADQTSDVAPNDDTTIKKVTVQRLGSDPTNAAFIKFSNSPGTPTNDFYLVLEEGS